MEKAITISGHEPPDDPTALTEAGEEGSSGLIAHIQSAMEHQKAALARELHDELGGLLVGAVMDIAWAEQHVDAPPGELKQKLTRARQTLSAAIDLKRKLIEDLRPTLLDNVGLFAALRWHVEATCKHAGLACHITVPEEEHRFLPNIPIALFRIVQEAIAVILTRSPTTSLDFRVNLERRHLVVALRSHGAAPSAGASGAEAHFLAAIEQRVATLGGEFTANYSETGETCMTARFPLPTTLMTP